MALLSPPRLTKPNHQTCHPTRWEKEKAASGDPDAFEHPEDPKIIGPWIIGETVGKGASGRVKLARHKLTGKLAAVKILPAGIVARSRNSLVKAEKHRMGIEREIVMMKLMEHPNIMRLYDVWEGERELFLILEWIEGGELFDLIVNRGRLPPLEALAYFKQIIHGLSYCHAFSIAHRDLKPENILIHGSKNEFVKIADWGMAAFQSPFAQLETSCGSPHYASPEIIRGDRYEGAKADIWSVGVVLFALVVGRLPFDDKNVPHLLNKVRAGKFEVPPYVYPEAADLIKKMLVVDVQKRITMTQILAHPFFSRDTPGIYYISPPSVSALHAPLISVDDIDQDILSSLRIIFGKHATRAVISQELTQEGPNCAKAFYVLLLKFRDRQMENFNGDRDDVDGKAGLHPYQSPRIQPIDHLSLGRAISPQLPAPAATRSVIRPTHARTQSSPTKPRSTHIGMRPRLPTISGTRPPRMPLPLIPVPSYATATSSSRGRDSAVPSSNVESVPVSPILSPIPPPCHSMTPVVIRPTGRRRETTPARAGLGLGITAPALQATSAIAIRPRGRRRDTSPSGPGPALGLGITAPAVPSSPLLEPVPGVPADALKPVPPPSPRVRRATSPAPPPVLAHPPAPAPLPPIHAQRYTEKYVPLTAPRVRNLEAQRNIDDLMSQVNVIAAEHNALAVRDNATPAARHYTPLHQQQNAITQREPQKPFKAGPGEGYTPYVYGHSNRSRERTGYLPLAEDDKENQRSRTGQRSRAGSEGTRALQSPFRPPYVHGHSNQSSDRVGHLPIAEEENGSIKSATRSRAGSEGGRSVQVAFKKSMVRKSRPTALDLNGTPPPLFSPRPIFNVTSPTSTPTTPLLSPVVGEFRGWFSNLFNWKTPMYILHSHNNCLTTRDETARLLEEFGVSILLEDVQGWGVLKCKVDEAADANGVVTQKQVKFRVEFQPDRLPPLVSPGLDGAFRALPLLSPQTAVLSGCTLTLVQEKGALSTFKAVYENLRNGWRLNALQSPAVENMAISGGRASTTMESGVVFLR